MPTTPYRFHEFNTPTHSPFEPGQDQWTTILREFIEPVIRDRETLLFWFCNHGADFQFCFAAPNYAEIETALNVRMLHYGFSRKTSPTNGETVATAFGGDRWIPTNKLADAAFVAKRSKQILHILDAVCRLQLDCLVQDGVHWRREVNGSVRENPLGNVFESVQHLIANISQAQFDVHFGHATSWMPLQIARSFRCNL